MLTGASAAILVAMVMALVRTLKGPSIFDRILAINSFGTKTVLAIALISFLVGRPDYLDVALVYALINFISTVAVLKFVVYGDFSTADDQDEPDD